MTLINNGRAPAKVRKGGCPWRLWGGHPAAVAVRKLPASTRFNCGPGGLWEGGVRPIGNLRHLSVMLDLAAFTRHGTGERNGRAPVLGPGLFCVPGQSWAGSRIRPYEDRMREQP